MPNDVTPRARQFIARHLHSVEQLEVLLLLRGAPDRDWPVQDVARALVSSPDSVDGRLRDLERRGLLERGEAGWRYAAGSQAGAVDDVAEAYATRRVTVVGLIFSKPSERLRSER